MTTTTIKLLEAAADAAGGTSALAQRLDISETLLAKFLAGSRELPDPLLLRAVDVILEDRQPPAARLLQADPSTRLRT